MSEVINKNFKIVEEKGHKHFVEVLEDLRKSIAENKIRGIAIVTLEQDLVYTDIVASDGTSISEVLGAIEVLKYEALMQMKGGLKDGD